MILLCGIAAGVGHEEATLVQGDAFWLVAYLSGCHDLEGTEVYLSHEAFVEILRTSGCLALMAIAGDIDIAAVGAKLAIIGYVLGGSHSLAFRSDELHDVRPVHGDGDEVVVHLDDVIGSVAYFLSVHITEP